MSYLKFNGYNHLDIKSNGQKSNPTFNDYDRAKKIGAFRSSPSKLVLRIAFIQHLTMVLII